MQQDIDTVATARPVQILGVNEIGHEGGNGEMCQGRTLPWLQDRRGIEAWRSWHVANRDVVVLDADTRIIRVYNLTENNLADSARYAELRAILIAAAQ